MDSGSLELNDRLQYKLNLNLRSSCPGAPGFPPINNSGSEGGSGDWSLNGGVLTLRQNGTSAPVTVTNSTISGQTAAMTVKFDWSFDPVGPVALTFRR
jgi:hypothetical protein